MWFVYKNTQISMTLVVVTKKYTHAMTLVDPQVDCEKSTHEITLVIVSKKNTHAMTLVDPCVVCEKNRHAITLGEVWSIKYDVLTYISPVTQTILINSIDKNSC